MENLLYQYEPYLGQNNQEIPCFRIYADSEVIAQTNEDMPLELQEITAQRFIQTEHLKSGLQKALYALKASSSNEVKDNKELIAELEQILAAG